jgi:hypothetical protein
MTDTEKLAFLAVVVAVIWLLLRDRHAPAKRRPAPAPTFAHGGLKGGCS